MHKASQLLQEFDLLAVPVTMRYKGLEHHPTYCGGIVSILVIITIALPLSQNIYKWLNLEGNEYY